jgi:hypothetical protein
MKMNNNSIKMMKKNKKMKMKIKNVKMSNKITVIMKIYGMI